MFFVIVVHLRASQIWQILDVEIDEEHLRSRLLALGTNFIVDNSYGGTVRITAVYWQVEFEKYYASGWSEELKILIFFVRVTAN